MVMVCRVTAASLLQGLVTRLEVANNSVVRVYVRADSALEDVGPAKGVFKYYFQVCVRERERVILREGERERGREREERGVRREEQWEQRASGLQPSSLRHALVVAKPQQNRLEVSARAAAFQFLMDYNVAGSRA
jgi:hypothetical protein